MKLGKLRYESEKKHEPLLGKQFFVQWTSFDCI